jgi:hypothetical protein
MFIRVEYGLVFSCCNARACLLVIQTNQNTSFVTPPTFENIRIFSMSGFESGFSRYSAMSSMREIN